MTTTDPKGSTEAPVDGNQEPEVETERGLVVREARMATLPPGELLAQVQAWGKLMAASGYFRDARSEAQAAVKVLYGLELGFTPGASMAGVHIIEGRPTLSASLQAQALRRSGRYDYRVVEHDNDRCVLEFYEIVNGEARSLGASAFTMEDAKRAGIDRKDNWVTYPRNMLFARAMTNGITFYCPDAFEVGRVYTPDELKPDLNLTPDGSVIDIGAITVEPTPVERSRGARQERQQQRERAPRVEQSPTEEPSSENISNVGQLLTWAINLRKFHNLESSPGAAFAALGVTAAPAIAEKYRDNWQEAARLIRAAFLGDAEPPSDPAEGPPSDEGAEQPTLEAEVEPELPEMTPEQRTAYDTFVADGVDPRDALTAIGVVQ